jgi:hypothetical protein
VEVLAARTLSLATLGPQRQTERRRESVAELEALAGASLVELRQKLPTRYWVAGMLALMGKSTREIAALVVTLPPQTGPASMIETLGQAPIADTREAGFHSERVNLIDGESGPAPGVTSDFPWTWNVSGTCRRVTTSRQPRMLGAAGQRIPAARRVSLPPCLLA